MNRQETPETLPESASGSVPSVLDMGCWLLGFVASGSEALWEVQPILCVVSLSPMVLVLQLGSIADAI